MKLSGWTRLGIAISILWIIIAVAVAFQQVATATAESYGSLVTVSSRMYETPHVIDGQTINGETRISFNKVTIAVFILIPLTFIWLGIPLLAHAFRWVRRGFRGEP